MHTRRDDPDLRARISMAPGVLVDHVDAGPPRAVPEDESFAHTDEFSGQLTKAWRRQRPDLVHAHGWTSGVVSLHAARGLDIPVVQTFHALGVVERRHRHDVHTGSPERDTTERMLLRDVDRVIATSEDEVHELRALGGDPDRITVVPCGVEERFSPWGGRAARPDPSVPRVVTVSRLLPHKGIDDAIRAVAAHPTAELLVAGGPDAGAFERDPEVVRLRAVAEDAGAAERVRFLGRLGRDEVAALLRTADVAVCAPWFEPLGIAALEAMACGVPVLATGVGAMLDTVVDGGTGILVPPGRPDLLATELVALLGDDDRRATMAKASARRARRYRWERVGSDTITVYEETLASPRSAPAVLA